MSVEIAQQAGTRHGPGYGASVLIVLVGGMFFSLMGLGVRSIEEADAWQILFYRSLGAMVPVLAVILYRSGGRPIAAFRAAGSAAVFGGIVLACAFAGSIVSLKETTVANASFLFAASPFFAALIGRIVLGERVRPVTWLAMAIAGAGIATMVIEGLSLGRMLGNLAGLGSALGFAAFTVSLRWNRSADMFPTVFHAAAIAAIVCAILSWYGSGLALSLRDAGIAIGLGVFALGAGMILLTIGARAVPAAEIAFYTLTEVVLAPVWVYFMLGEEPGFYTIVGGAVLLFALTLNALVNLSRNRARKDHTEAVSPPST